MACLFSSCKSFLFGVFIIVASFIPNSDARDCQTSSDVKRFGTNCQYFCHCNNNDQCDATTGECDSGCDFGWVGPACQYKNIAIGKESRHIDNKDPAMHSYRANDRDLSTCSYTGTSETFRPVASWWTLWLSTYTTIRKLTFLTHKDYPSYFPNFKLKVQNYSAFKDFDTKLYKDDGILCYQHDASIPSVTRMDVTCTGAPVGNLLRLQLANTSTQLVLCDFRLYGDCMYGDGCRHKCNINCNESGKFICDPAHGTCLHGCKSGWTGQQCKIVCGTRKWGPNCAGNCGNCAARTCDRITGNCGSGCAAGYKNTSKCVDECDDGTYGNHCAQTCGMNCINFCNKTTGTCSKCNAGWTGEYCKDACVTGKWGSECANSCGNCRNGTCDHETGKCATGCAAGYQHTDKCVEVCEDGTYGLNCTNICTNCLEGCDKVTGICSTCNPGWEGDHCTAECESGKWDSNCLKKCGNCSSTPCNRINGHCLNGCKAGIKPTVHCNTECDYRTFGLNCSNKCSRYCVQPYVCDKVTGRCPSCKAGWRGLQCKIECESGKWGVNCVNNCGNCLNGSSCDRINGMCKGGCNPGYRYTRMCDIECESGRYGNACLYQCSANCVPQGTCKPSDGTCTRCQAGLSGKLCDTECEEGKYGENCETPCGSCAENKTCNHINGICADGCRSGYQSTSLCQQVCSNGSYGVNCSEECGNCKKGSTCNKSTGVCHEGCLETYTGATCQEAILQSSEPSMPVVSITGGIIGAVVAALIACVVIIWKKRRNQDSHPKRSAAELSPAPKSENRDVKRNVTAANQSDVYVNVAEVRKEMESKKCSKDARDFEEDENESAYYNTQTEHEVLLSKLETYVKTGLANDDFINQFKLIPYGMQYSCSIATRPANHGKNRYKEMYAYDHSRVVLKAFPSQPDKDYINATFVKGYSGDNSYIAAQGPIVNTLDDFLRMIWEKNVKTIVMATNLSEQGKMKCIQYWPEVGQSMKNGNIIVSLETEDVLAEFTVRRLKVSHEEKPEKTRIVTQFHYTAWPDKDVPRSTSSLLHFWYQVRRHDGQKTRPWLVHCSAGVGRTGTFIALDILYDQGKYKGSVDIYSCVEKLRKQRVNMVQTKFQYSYLHSIMVEAFVLPSQPVTSEKFQSVYNDLKKVDKSARKTKLLLQYETLQAESENCNNVSENDIYSAAKMSENKNKNRFDKILAPDEFRPFLLTQVPGCTNYINSVFMQGYWDKFAYIITQTPLKSTAIDCCRLMFEQEVKLVVTFHEHDNKDIGVYLPGKGSVKIGPFTMSLVAEENKTNCTKRDYELLYESEKRCVSQVIFKHWTPSKLTPTYSTKAWYFLEELDNLQRQNDSKPIMIQCLNGADRSGLFVVLMNILERLRFDQEVSIPLVIRQLKIRRQQIIPNFEQFKFCHEVVLSHIENNTTYANM